MKKKAKKSLIRGKNLRKKDVRGLSKAIPLIVIAVLLVGAGAFFFMGKGGNPLKSLVGKSLNPNCEYKDPDLCKFFNNWKELNTYSMKSSTKSGGVAMDSVFESQGTDKTHMVSLENGKELFNTITIGDTTYTKDYTDNKWFKQTLKKVPNVSVTPIESDPKATFDDKKQMEDKTEFKSLGKEACGTLTCFKYQVVSPTDNGTKNFIFFDDGEYLIRKESMVDAQGNTSDVEFSYDAVSINPPSPVKEGEPGAGALPGLSEEDKKTIEQFKQGAGQMQQGNVDNSAPADNPLDSLPPEGQ